MFVCCTWKPGKRGVMVELWTKIDVDFSFVSNVVHTPHTNIVSSHFGPLRVRSEVSIRPTATTYRECRTKPLSPIIDTSGSAPFNFRWLRIGHCFCSTQCYIAQCCYSVFGSNGTQKFDFQIISNCRVTRLCVVHLILFVNLLTLRVCEVNLIVRLHWYEWKAAYRRPNKVNSQIQLFHIHRKSMFLIAFSSICRWSPASELPLKPVQLATVAKTAITEKFA